MASSFKISFATKEKPIAIIRRIKKQLCLLLKSKETMKRIFAIIIAVGAFYACSKSNAAIRVAIANGTMPKTGSLTTEQRSTILCWIDDGAVSN